MKHYLAVLSLLISSSMAYAELIPVEHFAKHAKYEDAVISPTGKYLAVQMRHENGRRFVAILNTKDMTLSSHIPQYGKSEPYSPTWISDERVAVNIIEPYGDLDTPQANGEIFAMNADGSKKRLLAQHNNHVVQGKGLYGAKNKLNGYADIIHLLPTDKNTILISYFPFGTKYEKRPHAYKINIFTGKTKRITVAPSIWAKFITDGDGNITHSVGFDTSTNDLLIHKFIGNKWEFVERIDNVAEGAEPIAAISGSNELLIKKTQESGPSKVYKLNIDTQKYSLVYKHNLVDPGHIVLDRKTNNPIAIHFDPGYPDLHLVDKKHPIGQWYPSLYQLFGGKRVVITSATDDYKTLVLHVSADNEPGQFHLFDTENKKLRFILQAKPWLNAEQLATTEPFTFKSSDGLELHGYLTKPKNFEGKLPLIVHPHGGPHGPRDYWEYNDDVQLLASRGYAVLQVNFRGSGGYGNKFMQSGYRHWGDLIQNDIIEATQWAIKTITIDPKRICIYGASFGAYSALMTPTLAPDLFQCAVGYAGVYDLKLIWIDGDLQKMQFGETYLEQTIGTEEKELTLFSPAKIAHKINIPVFLAHGNEDIRTPVSQFYAMEDALKKAKNPPKTLLVSGEGHGFYQRENRQKYYEQLIGFLDKHIGISKNSNPL